jgi:hypothetical protein
MNAYFRDLNTESRFARAMERALVNQSDNHNLAVQLNQIIFDGRSFNRLRVDLIDLRKPREILSSIEYSTQLNGSSCDLDETARYDIGVLLAHAT